MIVRNLPTETVENILFEHRLLGANYRREGSGVVFRLRPLTSDGDYARRSPSGRRGPWACYHGFRDFGRAVLSAGGTFRTVGPTQGRRRVTYKTEDQFEGDLEAFAYMNIGSHANPACMVDLCECRWMHQNPACVGGRSLFNMVDLCECSDAIYGSAEQRPGGGAYGLAPLISSRWRGFRSTYFRSGRIKQ